MPPTLREIARASGVDISTVSRVLTGKARAGRIGEATARKVEAAARALGFRANLTARALRTKRTQTLGLLVSDLENPFFAGIAGAVEAEAAASGYALMVATSGESKSRQDDYLTTFVARQIDGLIVAPAPGSTKHPTFASILKECIPLVLVDRLLPALSVDAVLTDSREAAVKLVRTLAAQGAKRVAFAGGPEGAWTAAERLAGFLSGLESAGLPADPALVLAGSFTTESGREATSTVLRAHPPPDAIVAANNRILTGVLEALAEAGQEGRRIAVAGFDGVPLASLLSRPLVVADQPVAAIGREAARLVIDRLAGSDRRPKKVVLPNTIETFGV